MPTWWQKTVTAFPVSHQIALGLLKNEFGRPAPNPVMVQCKGNAGTIKFTDVADTAHAELCAAGEVLNVRFRAYGPPVPPPPGSSGTTDVLPPRPRSRSPCRRRHASSGGVVVEPAGKPAVRENAVGRRHHALLWDSATPVTGSLFWDDGTTPLLWHDGATSVIA